VYAYFRCVLCVCIVYHANRKLTASEQITLSMELLLAIQSTHDNTFLLLDEHDVISKYSARRSVIDAVCKHARDHEKQVLYMTRGSLSSTPAAADLKVIAMQSVQR
jgi:hypothetical protein